MTYEVEVGTKEPELEHGTIAAIGGHPMSGLWVIMFEDADTVYISSGYGIRQLVACFGSFEAIMGKRISFTRDWAGVMDEFFPEDDDNE